MDLPMCELLGNGKQRDKVETLGYLFYVSNKEKAKGYLEYLFIFVYLEHGKYFRF